MTLLRCVPGEGATALGVPTLEFPPYGLVALYGLGAWYGLGALYGLGPP